MLIFASSQYGAVEKGSLSLSLLTQHAALLQSQLLRLGFLFCLLGYGTKAGVFPLHSWLPDAHSEAPAPASAMLSGGLLNCALFAIWRFTELMRAAGQGQTAQNIALTAGVITIVAASLFLVRQHGLKRMLAYSSVENVGLMLTAIGLGSGPLFFLIALNHSAAKVALFLVSGNIIQATGTKSLDEIRGMLSTNPCWAAVLILAGVAVTGSPPFGSFIAEWSLLAQGSQLHLWPIVIAVLLALAVSFLAVMSHIGKIVCGTPGAGMNLFRPKGSSLIPVSLVVGTFVAGAFGLLSFLR
ncbi:MAG: proton-conducting transporter membrane subunit, partial [Terriglobales bacterium]